MKKLFVFLFLLGGFYFAGEVQAATFFIDPGCNTPGDGTTATCNGDADDSFGSFDTYTDNARSAGDFGWVRRGTASTTNMTDLTFTSDGNLNNPITLSADYDNLWGEFASSTQTYTVTFGSKTMTASATISDIAANDWIYVGNDHNPNAAAPSIYGKDFAYEVASVVDDVLTLYLPYKGNQSGAGLQLRIMPDAPIWNTTTGDFQFAMASDEYWYIKGVDIRGTDSTCNIIVSTNESTIISDVILQGNGTTDCGIRNGDFGTFVTKTRGFGHANGFANTHDGGVYVDGQENCNSVASSEGFSSVAASGGSSFFINFEVLSCTADIGAASSNTHRYYIKNSNRMSNSSTIPGAANTLLYFEDDFGIVGLNSQSSNQVSATTISTTTLKITDVLRTGGGASSQLIFPPSGTADTGISTRMFPMSFIKLFEYPIYADDSSKTYSVYFNSTSTGHWTANPTASEFWVECEYYNESSGADRYLKKSTDTINFAGITTWDSLDVTCDPTQAGILYLRGWYGKPRETGTDDTNTFYQDVQPVIQ